ncbi:MAG TPA: methylated-DNA--[protein]-cysteine S-methyltransferase [Usitatibacter sp.]|jgi:methylated-DNA-[protein]-cysteine S-methyltransferase|nr:methylated-DNA--[protein]-cysteine S-methyltransferase [Usitatibacter sp.]
MTSYLRFDTPLGPMVAIAADGALAAVDFTDARYARPIGPGWCEDPRSPILAACARQLVDYFAGRRHAFDLPLAAAGTPFQRRVWNEISRIPYGETVSYTELAARAGAPGAARAAGAATGRNPLAIVVPCHRVVGARGALTGYAGGIDRKTRLLALEGAAQKAAA